MALTRAQLNEARTLDREAVTVPGLPDVVIVRTMTADEREDFDLENARLREAAPKDDERAWFRGYRLRLLVRCLCDESDARLYQPGEEAALGALHPRIIAQLFDVADRLNAVTARAVDDLAGKSEADRNGASSSGSPSPSDSPTPTT